MAKHKTTPCRSFETRISSDIIEVWLGPLDDPESEMVLNINIQWVPALIWALSRVRTTKQHRRIT